MTTTAVPAMSAASSRRLEDALEKIAVLVEEGQTPQAAFVKTAGELDLPAGQVRFLVQVYNTSSQETQRRLAGSRQEKAAAFAPADADAVLRDLYPEKRASRPRPVSPSYREKPPDLVALRQRQELTSKRAWLEKQAFVTTSKPAAGLAPPSLIQARRDWEAEVKAADERRTLASYAKDRFRKAAADLDRQITSGQAPPLAEIEALAPLSLGKSAQSLARVLVARHDRLRDEQRHHKSAGDLVHPFYAGLAEAGLLAEAVVRLEGEAAELCEKAGAWKTRLAALSPPDPPGPVDPLGRPRGEKQGFFGVGSTVGAVAGESLLRDLARQIPGMKPTSELKEDVYSKLLDPFHEQQMHDIHSEAVLNNLLANDPVIGGHDPNVVMAHYNELVGMAPHLATNLGAIRSALRKRMHQGSLDQYDLESLMKMEDLSKRQQQPNRGITINAQPA